MLNYLARRLLFAIFVLWGAVTVVFITLRLIPGDPARVMLGPDASAQEVAALQEEMGLNEPLLIQYGQYLFDVLRLDFGDSIRLGGDAMAAVVERMPMTATLALTAVIIAVVCGILLGTVSALNPGRPVDRLINIGVLFSQSLPGFWVGIVLILVLARWLNIFPSGGTGGVEHFILPAFTLSLGFMALMIRMTRSGLLEALGQGHVATARAKGLPEAVVVFSHGVRNALVPLVTVIGLYVGSVLGGSVLIETVFSWPGVGRLLVDSIGFRDYSVVQACILLFTAIVVLANLVVDILYGLLDPRIRAEH